MCISIPSSQSCLPVSHVVNTTTNTSPTSQMLQVNSLSQIQNHSNISSPKITQKINQFQNNECQICINSENSEYLPSIFHVLSTQQNTELLTKKKIIKIEIEQQLLNNPNKVNVYDKLRLAQASLYLHDYELAKEQYQQAKKLDSQHYLVYFVEYALQSFKSVSASIESILAAIISLKKSLILNPNFKQGLQEINTVTEWAKTKWKQMYKEGKISQDEYNLRLKKLEECLNEDPFAVENVASKNSAPCQTQSESTKNTFSSCQPISHAKPLGLTQRDGIVLIDKQGNHQFFMSETQWNLKQPEWKGRKPIYRDENGNPHPITFLIISDKRFQELSDLTSSNK